MALRTIGGKSINLENRVSNLEKKISDTGWITLVSWSSESFIKYRKKNGVVYVNGQTFGVKSSGNGNYVTMGTLPTGYKPKLINLTQLAVMENRHGLCRIDTDGSIKVLTWGGTSTYWGFETSYPEN